MEVAKEPLRLNILSPRFQFVRALIGVMVAVCISQSQSAQAESVKKLVFSDCKAAQAHLGEIKGEDKRELVEYLGRVLLLESQGIDDMLSDPAAQPKPAENPLGGPSGLDMWRTLQPRREVNAKLCAVTLLENLAPEAFDAVPEMIKVAQLPTTPLDLLTSLDHVIWPVTTSAARDPVYVASLETFARLLKLSDGEHAFYSENALVEFHKQSVPWLLAEIRKPSSTETDRAANILLRIDVQGEQLAPLVLPLLQSSDAALRLRAVQLLKKLRTLSPETLPTLVMRLADFDEGVRKKAFSALRDLADSEDALRGLAFPDDALPGVLRFAGQLNEESWSVVERLLVKSAANQTLLLEQLKILFTSGDEQLRLRAVSTAGLLSQQFAGALEFLTSALYVDSIAVRVKAIQALGRIAKERAAMQEKGDKSSEQIVSAILKYLKSAAFTKNSPQRRVILGAVSSSAIDLSAAENRSGLIPYLVENLSSSPSELDATVAAEKTNDKENSPVVQALIAFGPEVIPPVTRALKSSDPAVRTRSIQVLSSFLSKENRILKDLLQYWNDRDVQVRWEVADELKRHPEVSPEELLKLFRSSKGDARYTASEILLARGLFEKEAVAAFREGFAQQSCSRKSQIFTDIHTTDSQLQTSMALELVRCLREQGALRNSILEQLQSIAPVSSDVATLAISLLAEPQFDDAFRVRVIKALRLTEHEDPKLNSLVEGLLKSSDNTIRQQLLDTLGTFRTSSENVRGTLRKIAEDSDAEPGLRARAAAALFQIDSKALNFQEYFEKEFKSERFSWAVTALTQAPLEQSVPLLLNLHKKLPDLRKFAVLQGLASLPLSSKLLTLEASPEARSALAEIRSIAEEAILTSDHKRRFQGFRLLLELAPDSPSIESALRAELVGPYANELLELKIYSQIPGVVDQILAAPQSFVESQMAQAVKSSKS